MASPFVRLNFGKYRGRLLGDVPSPYLRWCLRECECLEDWLREEIIRELHRRLAAARGPQARPPVDWNGILTRWYREMCLAYHPDRGGSKEQMQAINFAAERLKEILAA